MKINKYITVVIVLLLSLTSCVKDDLVGIGDKNHDKGIRIYASTVSHTVVDTRATTNEVDINELELLVFDGKETTSKLTERVKASVFSNGEIYASLTYTPAEQERYVQLVANAGGIIAKAGDGALQVGITLAEVRQQMNLYSEMVELDKANGEGYNITMFPKTSELIEYPDGINYSTTLGTRENPLLLTNRTSKISAESTTDNLNIESISLHNAPYSGGQLLYEDTAPQHDASNRIDYYVDASNPLFPGQNRALNVFSSMQSKDRDKQMELVVKGKYASDENSTYYRIRFQQVNKETGIATLVDFKPNHHYKVSFKKVTTRGYSTLQEALDNECSNVEIEISDDSSFGEVLTNGQYMLATSNSECQIYGDFDPEQKYTISTLITNAPLTAQIEISSSNSSIVVVTKATDIKRDNQENPIEVQFKGQFVSGNITIRIGNLIRVIAVSMTVDPTYIAFTDVMNAKVTKGFSDATISLAYFPYDEDLSPYTDGRSLLENIDANPGNAPVFIHFNKVTLGDTPRFGEAFLTHHNKITHTKVIVYQRPWVEIEGIKFQTGNIVVGWNPITKNRCYKVGAAAEYGALFMYNSPFALQADGYLTNWNTSLNVYIPTPLQGKDAAIGTRSGYSKQEAIYIEFSKTPGDPCKALTYNNSQTWRTPNVDEMKVLVYYTGGGKESRNRYGFRYNPTGTSFKESELFSIANGFYWNLQFDGERSDINSASGLRTTQSGHTSFHNAVGSFIYPGHPAYWYFNVRCIAGNEKSSDKVYYSLIYPDGNGGYLPEGTENDIARPVATIETPLSQKAPMKYIIRIRGERSENTFRLSPENRVTWLKMEKIDRQGNVVPNNLEYVLGSCNETTDNYTDVVVTVSVNEESVNLLRGYYKARITKLVGGLNLSPRIDYTANYLQNKKVNEIVIYQGGYLQIAGHYYLDRALQHGQSKPDVERLYASAIPIGFSHTHQAGYGFGNDKKPIISSTGDGYFQHGQKDTGYDISRNTFTGIWSGMTHDPCPTGWCVPYHNTFKTDFVPSIQWYTRPGIDNLVKETYGQSNSQNSGRIRYSDDGIPTYLANAGEKVNGTMNAMGTYGVYWSSTMGMGAPAGVVDNGVNFFYWDSTITYMGNASSPNRGYQVRCVIR